MFWKEIFKGDGRWFRKGAGNSRERESEIHKELRIKRDINRVGQWWKERMCKRKNGVPEGEKEQMNDK